jgi:hypothetical protein
MTIAQRYEAYRAECAKTDGGKHGAILREHTQEEQALFDDWQQAIRNCATWRDGNTTWHVLSRYQDEDLEMWRCRIEVVGKPAVIADCYASYVRELGQPVDD